MKKTIISLALVGALTGLTACGGSDMTSDSTSPSGSNAPSSSSQTEEVVEDAEQVDTAEENSGPQTHKFGDTATAPTGLSVSVSEPSDYTPDEYAAGGEDSPNHVKFTIKVVNKTGAAYDPMDLWVTLQSSNVEADEVFDDSVGEAPSTTVLNGREITYDVAFGVNDPKDLVMEIQTGEAGSTIFTNTGE